MIISMTGYGAASGSFRGMELTVELKSVNNRYLDTNIRLPRSFLFAEEPLKRKISERISRGKVDVFVTINSSGGENLRIAVNEALLDGYVAALRSISEKYDLPFDLSAVSAARLPDVLSVEKQETDQE